MEGPLLATKQGYMGVDVSTWALISTTVALTGLYITKRIRHAQVSKIYTRMSSGPSFSWINVQKYHAMKFTLVQSRSHLPRILGSESFTRWLVGAMF